MEYLSIIKGSTNVDQLKNDDVWNKLGIFPLYEKITEYRDKLNIQFQTIEQTPT
jgi:hypothetical protein